MSVTQYDHPWTDKFSSVAFKTPIPYLTLDRPRVCEIHADCFRCESFKGSGGGWWSGLQSPVNIPSVMSGDLRKLTLIQAEGLYRLSDYPVVVAQESKIQLKADGSIILPYKQVKWKKNQWDRWMLDAETPGFALDIDISTANELDIQVWQIAQTLVPWNDLHIRDIIISGTYWNETPPVRADLGLTVMDSDTAKTISGALVKILAGNVLIAQKYTTPAGTVFFNQLEVGSYTIKVTKPGFEQFIDVVEVQAPAVEYDAHIVKIPVVPLPSWVIPAIIGTVAVGGLVTASSLVRRRPPVYVVK